MNNLEVTYHLERAGNTPCNWEAVDPLHCNGQGINPLEISTKASTIQPPSKPTGLHQTTLQCIISSYRDISGYFSENNCPSGSVAPNRADPKCNTFLLCTDTNPIIKKCATGLRFDPGCNCCNHAFQVKCDHSTVLQRPKPRPTQTPTTTKASFTKKPMIIPPGMP